MPNYPILTYFKKFSWKKLILLLPAPFLAQIETVKYPIIALLLLIIIDLHTAIVAHFVIKRREWGRKLKFNDFRYGIMSSGLRQTMKKSYQYALALITVFIIEVFGFGGNITFTLPLVNIDATIPQFAAWMFSLIEIKSIDENLKDVSGKSFLSSIFNIFKEVKKLKDDFNSMKSDKKS